jgi:hypothetical protein
MKIEELTKDCIISSMVDMYGLEYFEIDEMTKNEIIKIYLTETQKKEIISYNQ